MWSHDVMTIDITRLKLPSLRYLQENCHVVTLCRNQDLMRHDEEALRAFRRYLYKRLKQSEARYGHQRGTLLHDLIEFEDFLDGPWSPSDHVAVTKLDPLEI